MQTVSHAPRFISPRVICGILRIFPSPSGSRIDLIAGMPLMLNLLINSLYSFVDSVFVSPDSGGCADSARECGLGVAGVRGFRNHLHSFGSADVEQKPHHPRHPC